MIALLGRVYDRLARRVGPTTAGSIVLTKVRATTESWVNWAIVVALLALTILVALFFLRNTLRSECGFAGGQPPFCDAGSSVSNAREPLGLGHA